MSGLEQQKNINFGAKITGKIAAGIYLTGNDDDDQTLPGGGAWVRIGDGVVGFPLWQLMPVQPVSAPTSIGINDYFELQNPLGPTEDQALWYRYGKRANLYCSYSLSMTTAALGLIINSRVSSINPETTVTTLYPQSFHSVSIGSEVTVISLTFPLITPTSDAFFIEIDSNGDNNPVLFSEAFLSIYE